MKNIVKTRRLILRPLYKKDAPRLIAMLKSPEVSRTYMVPELETIEAEDKLFLRLYGLSHDESRFVWGIRKDGALIGMIHEVARDGGKLELGWFIDPAEQGRGYASEALAGVTELLFALGVDTVAAAAFEENAASLRVMRKCGLTPTGGTENVSYRGAEHRCVCCELKNDRLPFGRITDAVD